jgi:hypothetical protein
MTAKFHQALALISLALAALSSSAQTSQSTASSTAVPVKSTLDQIKNPVLWLTWGGDLRVRNEYFDNALSLTSDRAVSPLFAPVHEQDYLRFRGRLWTSIAPVEGLSLNVRLTAEPRDFLKTSTMDTFFGNQGMQWRYGILDTLNVQWKKTLNLPVTLTVGRQDIFLGDGWLVGDGSPEDGSFTCFLDASRVTLELKDLHTTIDAIGLVQDARPDGWLPTLGASTSQGAHPEPLLLTDQNEKGAILWVANKSFQPVNLDAYFIYKQDSRLASSPEAAFGDNANIYTLGARLSGLLQDHWKYSLEGAYQFGEKQDPELDMGGSNPLLAPSAETTGFRDLSAFGVNGKVYYLFKDRWSNRFSLSYEFLSGDNPGTANDEMFDVLWGRWPGWSEMYNIYSYAQETRVGQTANLHRVGPTWSVNPVKSLEFSASYFALFADQQTPTRDLDHAFSGLLGPNAPSPFAGANPGVTQGGNFRGHYLQSVLKYKFNPHLSGHLWAEFLFPGDYYVSSDVVDFLRAEVMFTF